MLIWNRNLVFVWSDQNDLVSGGNSICGRYITNNKLVWFEIENLREQICLLFFFWQTIGNCGKTLSVRSKWIRIKLIEKYRTKNSKCAKKNREITNKRRATLCIEMKSITKRNESLRRHKTRVLNWHTHIHQKKRIRIVFYSNMNSSDIVKWRYFQ